MSSAAGLSASATAWPRSSLSHGARSRDHTRGRRTLLGYRTGTLGVTICFRLVTPPIRSLARSFARLARRRRASVSVASRTLLSPGNSGYVATALYNGGRTWNRLAKVARVPGCCVENGRENAVSSRTEESFHSGAARTPPDSRGARDLRGR